MSLFHKQSKVSKWINGSQPNPYSSDPLHNCRECKHCKLKKINDSTSVVFCKKTQNIVKSFDVDVYSTPPHKLAGELEKLGVDCKEWEQWSPTPPNCGPTYKPSNYTPVKFLSSIKIRGIVDREENLPPAQDHLGEVMMIDSTKKLCVSYGSGWVELKSN